MIKVLSYLIQTLREHGFGAKFIISVN